MIVLTNINKYVIIKARRTVCSVTIFYCKKQLFVIC